MPDKVHLSDYITQDNCMSSLKLRGLPFKTSKLEIAAFFGEYNVDQSKVIIDISYGKPTGYALVFLANEQQAAQAKAKLDKGMIGTRYIDINYPTIKQQ